jgi:hypothetical protein
VEWPGSAECRGIQILSLRYFNSFGFFGTYCILVLEYSNSEEKTTFLVFMLFWTVTVIATISQTATTGKSTSIFTSRQLVPAIAMLNLINGIIYCEYFLATQSHWRNLVLALLRARIFAYTI